MPRRNERDDQNAYLPSASEIRRACLEIQQTWSEGERRSRAGRLGPITIPQVDAPPELDVEVGDEISL